MKFREKVARFMAGRNGVDQLNQALLWCYLFLAVLGLIWDGFTLLAFLVMITLFWRILSKNIYKRQAENRKYLTVVWKIKGFFSLRKRRFSERKTHRYRRCPHCKATVRLPYKKGKHTVCCPKCKKDFQVKI
ncbi:MAG: hypothetical protein IJN80_02180 [Clostridia bacterium]|nr:hypothetical protein [Clostridia bacterium]